MFPAFSSLTLFLFYHPLLEALNLLFTNGGSSSEYFGLKLSSYMIYVVYVLTYGVIPFFLFPL